MQQLMKLRNDFEREEQNMLLLRHPYLTIEQERNHMRTFQKSFSERLDIYKEAQREKFRRQISLADHLAHLRVTEAWD